MLFGCQGAEAITIPCEYRTMAVSMISTALNITWLMVGSVACQSKRRHHFTGCFTNLDLFRKVDCVSVALYHRMLWRRVVLSYQISARCYVDCKVSYETSLSLLIALPLRSLLSLSLVLFSYVKSWEEWGRVPRQLQILVV